MDSNLIHPYEGLRLFFRGAKGEGVGTAPYTPSAVTVRMWGRVNTDSVVIPLKKGTRANQDYNQIANPYPSPVDIGAVLHKANTDGQLNGGSFFLWNPYQATAGGFVTVHDTSSYVIAANTSFQVRAAYNSATLRFGEGNKANTVSLVSLKQANNGVLALHVYDENYHVWDELKMEFNAGATDNEDLAFDAGKPVNPDLNFYSWSNDRHPLSYDIRPYQEGKVIPLGFTSNYYQDFIIKVDNYSNPEGGQLYLHDKYLGAYTLVEQGAEYKFAVTKDPASQGDSRFELGMQPTGTVLGSTSKSLKVLMLPNPASSGVNITFDAPTSAKTSIRVLSLEGICIMIQELGQQQAGNITLSLDKLSSGVYMVELTSGNEKVVQRLVKE